MLEPESKVVIWINISLSTIRRNKLLVVAALCILAYTHDEDTNGITKGRLMYLKYFQSALFESAVHLLGDASVMPHLSNLDIV